MATSRITVLISGRGSNLGALLDAQRVGVLGGGAIVKVISNRPGVAGLELAARHGIETAVVDHKHYPDRNAFDAELAKVIDESAPDLVVLAGFMRILGADFVARYAGRMLNVHPSLLPSYPGLHTHLRALADGVRIHGCTVHFVTADLDYGPIVAQGAVPVHADDDEDSLAARVLGVEHQVLPGAVRAFCEGRLSITDGRVKVAGEIVADRDLIVPAPSR